MVDRISGREWWGPLVRQETMADFEIELPVTGSLTIQPQLLEASQVGHALCSVA
jgi:hypothetical protein